MDDSRQMQPDQRLSRRSKLTKWELIARKTKLYAHRSVLTAPRDYSDHFLCRQLRELMDEEALQDMVAEFRPGGTMLGMCSSLVSLVSPVLQKMMRAPFRESIERKLLLEDVDPSSFVNVLRLASGHEYIPKDLVEAVEIGRLAERFQVSEVAVWTEDFVMSHLAVENCAEVLMACEVSGLRRLELACRRMALSRFEEVAKSDGFMFVSEKALGSLLEEDGLVAGGEEKVFDAVVRWMKAGGERLRGEGLFRKIRFGLMSQEYLTREVGELCVGSEVLGALRQEAMAAGSDRKDFQHLCDKAFERRVGRGVDWARFLQGGERRLGGHSDHALALAECGAHMCSGSFDGTIRVWSKETLETEAVMRVEGDSPAAVLALVGWSGRLVSGHCDGALRVWDVAGGVCLGPLPEGHSQQVTALAVGSGWLASASLDETVRVWRLGGGGGGDGGGGGGDDGGGWRWPCERTLRGHAYAVRCVAVWDGKVVSGSSDTTVRVWEAGSGALEATLDSHTCAVTAVAVAGGLRLLSASEDGTIRAWALGSWAPLACVRAYADGARQHVQCLAVCGAKVVSGSSEYGNGEGSEIKVWWLDGLECEHTLVQPEGIEVSVLVAVGDRGEMWGAVGDGVVVWGRE